MTQLVVSEEQAELISKSSDRVEVRDAKGRILGVLSRRVQDESPDEIAEIKRRSRTPGPVYSTDEVLSHLRSLEAK
jgi:hypothetical protein